MSLEGTQTFRPWQTVSTHSPGPETKLEKIHWEQMPNIEKQLRPLALCAMPLPKMEVARNLKLKNALFDTTEALGNIKINQINLI